MYWIPDFAIEHLSFLTSVSLRTTAVILIFMAQFMILRNKNRNTRSTLLFLSTLPALAFFVAQPVVMLFPYKVSQALIVFFAYASGPLLWLLSKDFFDGHFKLIRAHYIIAIAYCLLAVVAHFYQTDLWLSIISNITERGFYFKFRHLLLISFLVLTFINTIKGSQGLNQRRNNIRKLYILSLIGINIFVILGETFNPAGFLATWWHPFVVILFIAFLFWFRLYFTRDTSAFLIKPLPYKNEFSEEFEIDFSSYIKEEDFLKLNKITIAEFSNKLGYPEYKVRKYIKVKFNVENFPTFINLCRVNQAKKLLTSKAKLSMEKIIDLTGFGSISSFNRVFKNITNLSPTQYRSKMLDI